MRKHWQLWIKKKKEKNLKKLKTFAIVSNDELGEYTSIIKKPLTSTNTKELSQPVFILLAHGGEHTRQNFSFIST